MKKLWRLSSLKTNEGRKKITKTSGKKRSIPELKPYERLVNDIVRNAKRPLSTNEVAGFGNMSWVTATKHLNSLIKKRKSFHTKKKGKTKLWYYKR